MVISSQIKLGPVLSNYTQEVIKNETMLFNCTWSHAYLNGGDPTKEFLLSLPSELHNDKTIIDSRVHMLMPGWFPCIPGFHHDDVPRTRADGQPNYYDSKYHSKHAMVLYNGSICPTEFAVGQHVFTDPNKHSIVYREWHKEVVEHIKWNRLKSFNSPSNQIIYFDDRSFHQGTKAVANGFRLFIRATWDSTRVPTNEIRKNAQVYLELPMEGW